MLEPDDRVLLVDSLRPPSGMQLQHAVGTTFSLDLDALLLAPVTFALRDAQVAESGASTDPLSILEAVRRHASNIDLFFQAGQVGISEGYRPMLAQLEEGVHPSVAPRQHHIFHPKVWLLRFGDGAGDTAYRLLVMSRNLSFSHSWDTMLRLDGIPATTSRRLRDRNRPLVDFLAALPSLSLNPSSRFARVHQLADEITTVEWGAPPGFTDLEFLVFGLGGEPAISPGRRNLVMSPFVSDALLSTLTRSGEDHVLISRTESLDCLSPQILATFGKVFTLNASANGGDLDDDPPSDETVAEAFGSTLVGLHAKVFVFEHDRTCEVVTGSVNATDAGFGGNVEFSVRLTGLTRTHGIEALLGNGDADASLASMLEPYRRTPEEPEPLSDADLARSRLEAVGRSLAAQGYRLTIRTRDDELYQAELATRTPISIPPEVTASIRLLSQGDAAAIPLASGHVNISFTGLSLAALTAFLRIDLATPTSQGQVATSVVAVAELIGIPEDRHERLLASLLQSREDVLRYLLFLLAHDSDDAALVEVAHVVAGTASHLTDRALQVPLFEAMVRALARNPESLEQVARLINDLSRTEGGKTLLPDGLAELWPAMDEARRAVT